MKARSRTANREVLYEVKRVLLSNSAGGGGICGRGVIVVKDVG